MDLLQVKGNQIVDTQGKPVMLRGVCVGGWMNMEEFINGYPGSEHGTRAAVAKVLGAELGEYFFDRMLDHFFAEEDVVFLKSLGVTVVRLPLNYRHFERDMEPFTYLEKGFDRLEQAIRWCEKHGIYVILDMHAVQGWQNTDWHCDNSTRHSLFWTHRHFQDRWVALWEEIARRYRGRTVIAGYNVMNEPVNNAPYGRFREDYQTDWDLLNHIYRRVVDAIRRIDPEHIIFLEGDYFSSRFDGLEPPFAPNLVYSSHNYTGFTFGPGKYPREGADLAAQRRMFLEHSGTKFCQRHNVPLWVGEFGATYNGPADEKPDRLRALDDQLTVFAEFDAHWTMWTYKDIHVMGWVQLDPQSAYLRAISSTLAAKKALMTDFWMGWVPHPPARQKVNELAKLVESVLEDETIDSNANATYMAQQTLSGYVAGLMQLTYARHFAGMGRGELDQVMSSFALQQCLPNQGLLELLRRHLQS